jgi:3-dehydroquinate synthase
VKKDSPRVLDGLASLRAVVEAAKPSSVCLVTSRRLAKELGWAVDEILNSGWLRAFVPDGEAAKEWAETEKLLARFVTLGLDRRSLVVALGGGTVGDAVGFAASIYLRGVRYAQVPTTLVAQADSALGGKTGVNFLGAKNQVGCTRTPIAIISDSRFLRSLAPEQIVDGLGEIIKCGFFADPKILALLEKETVASLPNSSRLAEIVERTAKVKLRLVVKDPMDLGARQLLNVGHTVGHAIEIGQGLSHGRAVLEGMAREIAAGARLGLTRPEVAARFATLLKKLRIQLDAKLDFDWSAVRRDKKVEGDEIVWPIVASVGKGRLVRIKLEKLKKNL